MTGQTRIQLTKDQLLSRDLPEKIVEGWYFEPVNQQEAATKIAPLLKSIVLVIPETPLEFDADSVDQDRLRINDQRIDLFPSARVSLIVNDNDLIPLERDLIRNPDGLSYWDLTVSPGRVWTEIEDDGWSRAALPFQLSNIFENDTHHGIATFVYDENTVSPIYIQVVAETKSFLCPDSFYPRGYLNVPAVQVDSERLITAVDSFETEKNHYHPLLSLESWRNSETEFHLDEIYKGFSGKSSVVSGLVINDEIFATPCRTVAGDYPYPRAMKFGIWSATKTAFCTIACMRVAKMVGKDPGGVSIVELIPEAKKFPGWHDVTIGNCLDMASGIGTVAPTLEPRNIFADYLLDYGDAKAQDQGLKSYEYYFDWFLAPSAYDKNMAAFACPSYPWKPGTVTRYRDQDLYIAGAALDAFLKRECGAEKRIWDVVRDEVYLPAHIYHAVKFHTIEKDPSKEVPLSDAGLLLTMDNVAGLGKLLHDKGKINGHQILDSEILEDIFDPLKNKGLPTGTHTEEGEIHYYGATWHFPYKSLAGKLFWIPTMRGYGGQMIQILPNGTTAFRFGFDGYDTEERYDFLKLARLSDTILEF